MNSLDHLMTADKRYEFFAISLEQIQHDWESTKLSEDVPSNVREIFDTAKNLSLYSWFAYDFNGMAMLTGFLALEKALRQVMNHALDNNWISDERVTAKRGIARARVEMRKVQQALNATKNGKSPPVSVEAVTEAEIETEAQNMKIVRGVCDAAIKLRNSFAHGDLLTMPFSHRGLRMTAVQINQ